MKVLSNAIFFQCVALTSALCGCSNTPQNFGNRAAFMSQSSTGGALGTGTTIIVKGKFFANTFEGAPVNTYTGELQSLVALDPQQQQAVNPYQQQQQQVQMQNQLMQQLISGTSGTIDINPFADMGLNLRQIPVATSDAGVHLDIKPATASGTSGKSGRLYLTAFDGAGIENFRLKLNNVVGGLNSLLMSPSLPDSPTEAFVMLSDGTIYAAGAQYPGSDGMVYLGTPTKEDEETGLDPNLYKDTPGYIYLQLVYVGVDQSATDPTDDTSTTGTTNNTAGNTGTTPNNGNSTTPTTTTPTFVADIWPIIESNNCLSCHDGSNASRLTLEAGSPGNSYARMTGLAGLLDTANPENSSLLQKITDGNGVSHAGDKLIADTSSTTYQTILSWIKAGAPLQ